MNNHLPDSKKIFSVNRGSSNLDFKKIYMVKNPRALMFETVM